MQYILILFTPGSPLPLPLGISQHGPLHLLILSYCFLCSSPLFFFVTQQVQLMLPAGTLSADDNLTLSRSRAGNYSYSELLSRHVQKTALHGTLLHPLAFPFLSFPLPWCLLSSRGWRCPTSGWALTVLYSQHLPSCYIDCRRKLLWPRLKALISGYKHN